MNRWLILVLSLHFAGCYVGADDNVIFPEPQQKQNGLIDWVVELLGGSTSPSTPIIDNPEPVECPACQCGIASIKRRIVGGHETKVRQYTWMVMLLYNGRMYCGGALICDGYILTAAHCTGFRKERMTVRLLEHDVTIRGNDTKIIDRKVSKIIRHQRYNPGTFDNDIALLKLDKRIDLSNAIKKRLRSDNIEATTASQSNSESAETAETEESTEAQTSPEPATSTSAPTEEDDATVRPVCLPTPGLSFTKQTGVVIGWGLTEQGGVISNTLQEVKVPIVSNMECRDRSYGTQVTDNMICAGEREGGRDACQGDSGGPLHVFNETTGKYQEVGVVSWGEGCAQPNKYGVYSRVNRYLTWIKSNTADCCYCD